MPAVLERVNSYRSGLPAPYRFTNDEFCRMGDQGLFEGRSVILVDGEIINMPPPNPPHSASVALTDYLLKKIFSDGYIVRVQDSLPTGEFSNLAPDIAVVPGSPRDYATVHPRETVLVVEVAHSSLGYDRGDKAHLYAAAGVPEYWVIDVNGRELIVFREPVPDADAPRGFRYASERTLAAADSVSPLAAPAATVRVADLLP